MSRVDDVPQQSNSFINNPIHPSDIGEKNTDPTKRRLAYRTGLMNQLTLEQSTQYERICKLRDTIGPVDCNVVDLIRELRGDD